MRGSSGHDAVHGFGAKVKATGPFHAAEIRVERDSIEDSGIQQFQEYAAALLRFDREDAFEPVVKANLQPVAGEGLDCFNSYHALTLVQRLDFGRLLILAGRIPGLSEFGMMPGSPFQHQTRARRGIEPFITASVSMLI